MNDHQDFHHFVCGRQAELECLHKILDSALLMQRGSDTDRRSSRTDAITYNVDDKDDSPVQRNCNVTYDKSSTTEMTVSASAMNERGYMNDSITSTATATDNFESNDNQTIESNNNACCTNDDEKYDDDRNNICKSHRRGQLVFVCGPAGSGKRTFVRATFQQYGNAIYDSRQTPITTTIATNAESQSPSYLLVSGRFRHYQGSIETTNNGRNEANERPLMAFDDVLREMYDLLKEDEPMLEAIRQTLAKLLDNPDSDIRLLVESFPFLKAWLQSEAVSVVSDQTVTIPPAMGVVASCFPSSKRRIHVIKQQTQHLCHVLTLFVRAITSAIPVAIILEDLHYADAASFVLIEGLVSTVRKGIHPRDATNKPVTNSKGLIFVTTYQTGGNNDETSNAFTSFMQRCKIIQLCSNDCTLLAIETLDATVGSLSIIQPSAMSHTRPLHCQRICLSEYTWDDVHQLIQKCTGFIQKCSTSQKRELTHLVFHSSNGNPSHIRYLLLFLIDDESILIEDINKKRLPKSLSDIYTSILLRQDTLVQTMIKTAAALAHCGVHDICLFMLDVSVNRPCIEDVMFAKDCGLLEYIQTRRHVKFYSTEMEIAAYNLIPVSDRPAFHLEIGRRMWRTASLDDTKRGRSSLEIICGVVLATSQFRLYIDQLTDFDECMYMSKSCYELGKEALFYADFNTAAKLFDFAIDVLGENVWRDDLYETTLVLHNATAQAYCYMGEFVRLQRTLDAIFDNAVTFRDKLPAYITLVYYQGTGHQLREAFITASATLKELGEPINHNQSNFAVAISLFKTKYKLRGKSKEYLVNLPLAENENDLVVAQLLCFASIFSYVVTPEIAVLLGFRLIRLGIDKGVSGPTAVAFSTYGFVLCAMGSFAEGYQYGQVAMELAKKFEVWRPRIYMFVYGYVNQWTHPIRDCIEPLQEAAQSAFVCGDLEIYAGSSFFLDLASYFAGTSLRTLEPLARSHCKSVAQYGNVNPLMSLLPLWSHLNDLTCDEVQLVLPGAVIDAETAFKYAVKSGNKYVVGSIYLLRTIWYYLVGDYKEALDMAKKVAEQRKVADYELTLYQGLVALAIASTSRSLKRRKYRNRGQSIATRMKRWAKRCPANFRNKLLLLNAEIAGLDGKSKVAIALFKQSIDKAIEEGFRHEEGIAYERMGQYQLQLGLQSDASKSFMNARTAFDEWGAIRLVRRIDQILATI